MQTKLQRFFKNATQSIVTSIEGSTDVDAVSAEIVGSHEVVDGLLVQPMKLLQLKVQFNKLESFQMQRAESIQQVSSSTVVSFISIFYRCISSIQTTSRLFLVLLRGGQT
jgi:hypothetical protein